MKLCFGCRVFASLSLAAILLAGGVHGAVDDSSSSEGHQAAALNPGNSAQPVRPFPRLTLNNGRVVEYVGVFSADAKFRASSRLSRFLDSVGTGPSPQPGRRELAPYMLDSYQRVVEDYDAPARAVGTVEAHSLPRRGLDYVVTSVYGHPAVIQAPRWLTSDSKHRVIISDPSLPAVHVIDPQRKSSFTILGGQGRRLQLPAGVAVDAQDNIHIADSGRGIILVYDQYGNFVRYIGNRQGENMYQRPTGIAIDRNAGVIYLADTDRNLILMLDLQGNILKSIGKPRYEPASDGLRRREVLEPREFNAPTELALGDYELVVLDSAGTRVRVTDLNGNLQETFMVTDGQQSDRGDGVGIDTEDNIYVSYAGSSEIGVYSRNGRLLGRFGHAGSRAGEFIAPRGLWVDLNDRLYVADTQNSRIQLFQLSNAR